MARTKTVTALNFLTLTFQGLLTESRLKLFVYPNNGYLCHEGYLSESSEQTQF